MLLSTNSTTLRALNFICNSLSVWLTVSPEKPKLILRPSSAAISILMLLLVPLKWFSDSICTCWLWTWTWTCRASACSCSVGILWSGESCILESVDPVPLSATTEYVLTIKTAIKSNGIINFILDILLPSVEDVILLVEVSTNKVINGSH